MTEYKDWSDALNAGVDPLEIEAAKVHRLPPPNLGATLLDELQTFLGRFIAYPSYDAQVAHVLWIVHTHLMDAWESTPRIAFLSPEPGSGKTRALEITELLVPWPVEAVNVTPAYLFRKVANPDGLPTVLFDEIDTVFGPKAKDNEEIRGLLNAGHRKGAVAGRCVVKGKTVETEEIPAYCAVALAGIGALPDTILSRSVIVKMRRRAPHEIVEPYRRRLHSKGGQELRERLAGWADTIRKSVTDSWPEMPPEIKDRDADIWEPLIAISDAAGGDWPERARVTAVTFVTASKESTPSIGIRLLSDMRDVFGDRDALWTDTILNALFELPESPWETIRKGEPLNSFALSRYLGNYDIHPGPVREDGFKQLRGYKRVDFVDAWERYLPASPHKSVTPVTGITKQQIS